MFRSRKPLATAAVLAVLSLGLLAVLRPRPVPYLSGTTVVLDGGVPEMQVAPVVACPPVLVQGVLQGRARPPESAGRLDAALRSPPETAGLATVYVITPTYPRAVQVPEMTRLAQTLMLTTNVFWVVTEDAAERTTAVTEILQRSGLPHVHILGLKPEKFSKKGFKGPVPRGVSNRMAALEWIRQNARDGVFYFADDDNTYDHRLFAEVARTRRVSVFPVGLVTQTGLSTPLVRDGAVVGFYDGWIGGRTFPMDMAGFAVSVQLLLEHPKAAMPFTAGYEEDGFLKSLGLKREDLEPLADNCTKILVWHTQTKQPRVPFTAVDPDKYRGTNLEVLRHVVNPSSSARSRARPPSSPAGGAAPAPAPDSSAAPGETARRSAAPRTTTGRHAAPGATPDRSAAPGVTSGHYSDPVSSSFASSSRHSTAGDTYVSDSPPASGNATVRREDAVIQLQRLFLGGATQRNQMLSTQNVTERIRTYESVRASTLATNVADWAAARPFSALQNTTSRDIHRTERAPVVLQLRTGLRTPDTPASSSEHFLNISRSTTGSNPQSPLSQSHDLRFQSQSLRSQYHPLHSPSQSPDQPSQSLHPPPQSPGYSSQSLHSPSQSPGYSSQSFHSPQSPGYSAQTLHSPPQFLGHPSQSPYPPSQLTRSEP